MGGGVDYAWVEGDDGYRGRGVGGPELGLEVAGPEDYCEFGVSCVVEGTEVRLESWSG